MQWFARYGSWSEEYLIFAICYAKNGNFQINLEVRGGPGEFFHGQVIIKIGLNFHFLGVTKSPRPPQNLAVLTAVLSTVRVPRGALGVIPK